jgi:transposase-like protein
VDVISLFMALLSSRGIDTQSLQARGEQRRSIYFNNDRDIPWVIKYAPLLEQQFRAHKLPVGSSWRLDETYVKVKGSWKYLYRAVDKAGATVDFLLTAKRDRKAALRFLRKAIGQHGVPEKITIDKSGANTAAIESYNAEHEADIEIRQNKYLNNLVEQDHRAVKRVTRPMLGFKSFRSAAATLAGVEAMHMIREGQIAPSPTVLCPRGVNLARPSTPLRPRAEFATQPPPLARGNHDRSIQMDYWPATSGTVLCRSTD